MFGKKARTRQPISWTTSCGAVMLAVSLLGCGNTSSSQDAGVSRTIVAQHASFALISSRYLELDVPVEQRGIQAAIAMSSIGTNAMGVLSLPDRESKGFTTVLDRRMRERVEERQNSGCACTDDSCEFTDCEAAGGLLLNGRFSWTEDSMTCDFEVAMASENSEERHHRHRLKCDLQYGEVSVSGQLSTKGSYRGTYQGNEIHTEWDLNMELRDVRVDEYGFTKSGQVELDAVVSLHSQGEMLRASTTVDFADKEEEP